MARTHRLVILAAVALAALVLPTVAVAQDAVAPTAVTGTPTAFIGSELRLVNVGVDIASYVELEVPLAASSSAFGSIVNEKFNRVPLRIETDEFGQRRAVFRVEAVRPGQEIVLTQRYEFAASGDARPEEKYDGTPNPRIEETAERIVATASRLSVAGDPRRTAAAILTFVNGHIRYDPQSPWRNSSALTALERREGVCEDYAYLFVALARAARLEARMVYGYRGPDAEGLFERHAWAEVRLDGKWLPVDPTFSPRLDWEPTVTYITQWHRDTPIRIRYRGGKFTASLTEGAGLLPQGESH